MFCENCGRKSNSGEVYCADCGTKLRTEKKQALEVNQIDSKNMAVLDQARNTQNRKSNTGLIVGVILGAFILFVIIIIAIIAFAFSLVSKYGEREYITFGNDEIPTVYSILGDKNLVSYKENIGNDTGEVYLEYDAEELTISDLENYLTSLSDYDFYEIDNDIVKTYVKESYDNGYVITVSGGYDSISDIIYIKYDKITGELNDYSLEISIETMRIGDNTYGYIDVPMTWTKYVDVDADSNGLSYINGDNTSIISLNIDANSEYSIADYVTYYADVYESNGVAVNISNETIDGYNAYVLLTSSSDGFISKEWFIKDNDNNIHYIYIGTYNNDDIFDYGNTYRLEN